MYLASTEVSWPITCSKHHHGLVAYWSHADYITALRAVLFVRAHFFVQTIQRLFRWGGYKGPRNLTRSSIIYRPVERVSFKLDITYNTITHTENVALELEN